MIDRTGTSSFVPIPDAGYRLNLSLFYLFGLFLLCALAFFLISAPALAQAMGDSGSFSCNGAQASGQLYDSGSSCPTVMRFDNVFSFLVCNMEHLSTNLMGSMFCGMVDNLTPAVNAVLVLAVVIFGLGFTIGVIPATARDFQAFLLKISFIWIFATNGDLIIDVGYGLLVNGMRDAVMTLLNNYNPSGDTGDGANVYGQLDAFLATLIHYATDYMGVSTTNDANANDCQNAVFAMLAIMGIAFPPLFFFALALLMKIAVVFARSVFGYIYALVGITFLLTLSPFFLSFYLFRQTRSFFDKWLGYLASFALQIVLLFAFLSFILSIDVKDMSSSFTALIIPVKETKETTSFRAPWEYCTLCDFQVVDKDTNQPLSKANEADFLSKGKLACKDNPGKPIGVFATVSPDKGAKASKEQQSTLLRFAGGGFMALLVLAYIVEALLNSVGTMAQMLASGMGGASYAPQLAGGKNILGRPTVSAPGEGLYSDFEDGLQRGFERNNNSVSGLVDGFKEGAGRMLTGRGGPAGKDGLNHSGVKNRFLDWLSDPNEMDHY